MKKWYYYMYYRITKLYKDLGTGSGSASMAMIVLWASFGFFTLAIMAVLKFQFSEKLIHTTLTPFLIIGVICNNEKKYKELERQYRNETHKTLKNWFTVLYILGSPILYGISLFIFT